MVLINSIAIDEDTAVIKGWTSALLTMLELLGLIY